MIFTNPPEIVKIRLQIAGEMIQGTRMGQLVLRSWTSPVYTMYVYMCVYCVYMICKLSLP